MINSFIYIYVGIYTLLICLLNGQYFFRYEVYGLVKGTPRTIVLRLYNVIPLEDNTAALSSCAIFLLCDVQILLPSNS